MQYFQPILIVIGVLAIGGVLIHGYLLSRKEKTVATDVPMNVDIFAEKSLSTPQVDATSDVIGEVKIISSNDQAKEENIDFSLALDDEKVDAFEFSESNNDNVTENIEPLVLDENNTHHVEVKEELTSEQAEHSSQVEIAQVEEDQRETLPEAPLEALEATDEQIVQVAKVEEQTEKSQAPDLFIFNVVASEDAQLGGHELLQFFLTSGFRFGEMSIFHRHEHSDGTGPILFSIANMMAPGVFDPENMEQFKSEGVSFFLTAPNKNIDMKSSFDMMLRAVEQMAEEFDCIVLNAEREPLTKEQFIEYNNRLSHYI